MPTQSVGNESIAQEELKKIDESDEEEEKHVDQIEGAHNVRLIAEKEDNRELKRRLSKLTNVVRRQTLKGDNLVAAAAIAASGMDASQASFDAQSMLSADAITTPEISP